MLRPLRLTLVRVDGIYRLQAATEALAARLLEGRVQSGLSIGHADVRGTLYGLYQPGSGPSAYRRITGGPEANMRPDTAYAGLVFASESLGETVKVALNMAECLGARVWGATRIGPRRLSAGVAEIVGDFNVDDATRCARRALGKPRIHALSADSLPLDRLSKPYTEPRWRNYTGAAPLPLKAHLSRDAYNIRVGVSLWEGKYIADARIDGVFHAAPPAEPFSTIAGITGMPVGDQVLMALEARFSTQIELYGITAEDVVEAFARAVGVPKP